MPSIEGISYTELNGSDIGSFNNRGEGTIQREFDVDWADRWTFMGLMLGGPVLMPDNNWYIYPPQYYPRTPLIAKNSSYKGIGEPGISGSDITYTKARIRITYGLAEFTIAEQEDPAIWMEESSVYKAEILQIPSYALKFSGTDEKITEPAGIIVITADITLVRYNVAYLDRAAVEAMCGKVNSATFLNYPAGTLLFMGFSPKRTINVYGWSSMYTVSVGIKYKPEGWNNFFRPGHGWTAVVINDDDDPLYESGDFSSL